MNDGVQPLIRAPITLRWRDLDAFNHVNNSTYLTYIEEARLVWFSRIEGPWYSDQCSPVVAATNINYRAQLAWPGNIVVELYCERIGNSSLTLKFRIIDAGDPEKVYGDGDVVLVWINPGSGRATPLPAAVRKACEG